VNRQMARLQQVVCWTLFALAAGCGGGDEYPAPTTSDGGLPERVLPDTAVDGTGDAPREGGGSEGGGEAGEAGSDARSTDAPYHIVTVAIDTPKVTDVMVAANRFTPKVRVTIDSSHASDPDTITDVTATVTKVGSDTSGASNKLSVTEIVQTPESAEAVHHYTDTPVNISKLESGEYDLEVTVTTTSGAGGTGKVRFKIDGGPVIRIEAPGENSYYRDSAPINVTVTDPLFEVQSVTMLLGQTVLMVNGPGGQGNSQYTGTITFGDFDPPLEGDQLLTVRATNENGTETVLRRKFISDNRGPKIESTQPAAGELIGRVITISAVVSDPAGVLDSSVVAVVAHGDRMFEVKLEAPAAGSTLPPGTYQALFDTARLPVNALFPSISFRASDTPGNQSAVGYLVSLDNTPPIADLDPPTDFYMVKSVADIDRCSWPFDPLGTDAVDDGENVSQLFDVRARIEDQGNTPLFGGTDFTPIAGIDDTRVQLLILDDTSKALVVDTNGDGFCDAVNPLLTPTTVPMSSSDALLVNLVPIPPAGDSNFMPRTPPSGAPCASGDATKPPDRLCGTTSMSEALYYANTTQSAIYTIAPVINDKLQCVGRQFDGLGNHVQDGWICLAVAASDELGNLQVSRPLRVCVNKDGMNDECGASRPAMPNCTGTQTATQPTVVVDATRPCLPWASFPAQEFRRSR
jgi:hypothetical protein